MSENTDATDMSTGDSSTSRSLNRFFPLLFSVIYLFIGITTLPDYGLTWDESWENYYGDKNLNYYCGFDRKHLDFTKDSVQIYQQEDHPDFHWVTSVFKDNDVLTQPVLIWPLAPTISSACKYVFYGFLGMLDPIDAHHMAPMLAGLILLLCVYNFARRHLGERSAVIAALVLCTYPRLFAHIHFNSKDVICALFFTLTIVTFYDGLTRNKAWKLYVSAVLWGSGLATKPNGLFLPFILGPLFILILVHRYRQEKTLQTKAMWGASIAYPLIGLATMFLCWPLLWMDFPDNVQSYIHSLTRRGYSGDDGWNIVPLKYAFATMPVVVLFLFLLGIAALIVRRRQLQPLHLMIGLWFTVPILRVCLPGARDFDGIRHWLEFIPALALLCGIGAGWVFDQMDMQLQRHTALVRRRTLIYTVVTLIMFSPLLSWLYREHPNQVAYFNPLVGRLAGARAKGYPEATDYWGSSYRQGITWLNENCAREKPLLVIGTAEHIVFYTYQIRLDQSVQLIGAQQIRSARKQFPGRSTYMMTILREGMESDIVHDFAEAPVMHQIDVDGEPILVIRRLE